MKCAFLSSMVTASLCEFNALNFKLLISNYAALYAFAHCHNHVISLACHFPFSWKLAIGEEMLYSGVRVVAVISNLWSTDISLRPIYRPIFRIF